MGKQKTKEQVIEDFKKVHGNKYDYSKVEYKKALEKVCIICPEHGEFWQTPNSHLYGRGCPKCGIEKASNNIKKALSQIKRKKPDGKRKTIDSFIEKSKEVHGNKYDYSKVNYINNHTKVCIICPEHGEFWQTPTNHMSGQNCPLCSHISRVKNKTKRLNEFIEKANIIHRYLYKYDKAVYKTARTNIIITCPKHGDFKQTPDNHLKGCGCPKCQTSILENKVMNALRENGIEFIHRHSFEWLFVDKQHKQSLDFYLPKENIAIECQGRQHLKPSGTFGSKKMTSEEVYEKVKNLDEQKNIKCKEHGIKMLYYTEDNIETYEWPILTSLEELLNKIKEFQRFT